jgi:hypothetical protein
MKRPVILQLSMHFGSTALPSANGRAVQVCEWRRCTHKVCDSWQLHEGKETANNWFVHWSLHVALSRNGSKLSSASVPTEYICKTSQEVDTKIPPKLDLATPSPCNPSLNGSSPWSNSCQWHSYRIPCGQSERWVSVKALLNVSRPVLAGVTSALFHPYCETASAKNAKATDHVLAYVQ